MLISKPRYYDRFRCLASRCPDSCCKEWDVQVDEASAAYYRSLPGDLGDRLRQVLRTEDGETVMTIEDGRCPMWRSDGLCRIQAELGEQALCGVCREFPRLRHEYGDFAEYGLELSCPEAARLILSGVDADSVTTEVPGGESGEYDREIMDILLASRRDARALLADPARPINQALAALLLLGYETQAAIDGGERIPFDVRNALESAGQYAVAADERELLPFFSGLEILTDSWRRLLSQPAPRAFAETDRSFARYLLDRYWLQAVSDFDLVCRAKLIVVFCLLLKTLGGEAAATAQLLSKELENDADNIDAILDAAYTHPAFTDEKLLGMLLT